MYISLCLTFTNEKNLRLLSKSTLWREYLASNYFLAFLRMTHSLTFCLDLKARDHSNQTLPPHPVSPLEPSSLSVLPNIARSEPTFINSINQQSKPTNLYLGLPTGLSSLNSVISRKSATRKAVPSSSF